MANNLEGMVFGDWTVLCKDNDKSKYKTNDARWICQCKCGRKKSVLEKYLKSGQSISCGCSKKKDLAGQRFGKLLVLETLYGYEGSNRAVYKCLCDCGTITYIKSTSIYSTQSCGCVRKTDIVGQKFGKLLVCKMLYNYDNKGITYCECRCDCGTNIITKMESLTSGNTRSCGCVHSPSLINKRFGRLVVVEELHNNNSKQRLWRCKCDCGCYIHTTSHCLTSGHTKSCGCLRSDSNSYNETLISKIFTDHDIIFEREKTFSKCKGTGNRSLRFDFYLPNHNVCIEYDGKQHYKPIDYFGGIDGYETLKANDEIKNNFCKTNNIKLIRIPYTFTEMQIIELINSIIQNPVTTTVA